MIREERLETLQKENVKIYYIFRDVIIREISDYKIVSSKFSPNYKFLSLTYENQHWNLERDDYKYLYETKEEAEFVAKYHCSKTIKFEPPTFEEFEAKGMTHWSCDNIEFDNYYTNEFTIREYQLQSEDYDKYSFEYEDNIESRKQAYYQAVEYAKKLFLGDE